MRSAADCVAVVMHVKSHLSTFRREHYITSSINQHLITRQKSITIMIHAPAPAHGRHTQILPHLQHDPWLAMGSTTRIRVKGTAAAHRETRALHEAVNKQTM